MSTGMPDVDAAFKGLGLDPTVMEAVTKMSLEFATSLLADRAEQFARELPIGTDGVTALTAFARAIRTTNAKRWPVKAAS